MCLILIAHRAHPDYPLVVAANRDEFHARPATAAAWWKEAPQILAGRDLQAGGTWLGITRGGRFAALTNFRDPPAHRPDAPSRGALVSDFLLGSEPPEGYLERLALRAGAYNGFNLVVGGPLTGLYAYCNRGGGVQSLAPGVHGISNGLLDEPWPKVRAGRAALGAALAGADPEALFAVLADRAQAADAELPDTGIGRDWERLLSSRFIAGPAYGTRCSTVVMWDADGGVRFIERSYDVEGAVTGTVEFAFAIKP